MRRTPRFAAFLITGGILGAILGYGELAQARAAQDPQLKRYLDTIVNAGNRAKSLVSQILAYSRAEGGVQLLETTLPSLITMLEGTNEMRFASMDDMLRAGRCPVRKWNKDDAGIEDVAKIGLKGSPTIVSKVFGPTPRSEKADIQVVADSSVNDICLNLLQKIFTTHPTLETETVQRLRQTVAAR